jgi:hypothetical protein
MIEQMQDIKQANNKETILKQLRAKNELPNQDETS